MSSKKRDLLHKFFHLQRLLHRYFHHKYMQHGPMGNIHSGQGRILTLLKLKPQIRQKDLAQILDMRPQSLGELLEKLEKGGYIVREPLEKDQRVMMISLTEAGKELAERSEQQEDADLLFAKLNEQEQETLNEYLDRIITTVEEKTAGHGVHSPHKLKMGKFCGPHFLHKSRRR